MAHLQRGGGAWRWRTWWRVPSTTPTLLSQRAKSFPLWSRLFPEIRIGRGLERIAQTLWGKAPCGARGACLPLRTPRRGATRRRKWRERPRVFWRWCATGQGEVVHVKIHHLPSPFRGRSLHSDPWREGHRAPPRSGRINRQVRFPHRRRDLQSLREKSVQEAFLGVLLCQRVRKSSLPGRAQGAAGVMEGPGERSPRSGVRRGRSPSPAPMYYIG